MGERLPVAAAVLLVFGVVSLLGDASYEGLRSLLPVEARGTAELGGLVGIGEVIAYGLRGATGLAAEVLGGLWQAVFLGYSLVPLGVVLALYGGPAGLAAGYWLERLGKAVRSPARDALLREAAPRGRRGLFFGIHEALDQLGAVAGPLIAYMVASGEAPGWVLALPGAATLPMLALARRLYRRLGREPETGLAAAARSVRRSASAAAAVAVIGLATPNPLAVAHVAGLAGAPGETLPLLYAVAMASDALAAVPLGLLYDRLGGRVSMTALVVSGLAAAAALLQGRWLLAALLSGVVESGFETVARAMARGAAGYGLLGAARGLAAGGSILVYAALYSLAGQA